MFCIDIFINSEIFAFNATNETTKSNFVIYWKGEVKQNTDFVYLFCCWMNWKIQ